VANVLAALLAYVQPRRLGVVLADVGFELLELPRTVRAPDVAFVCAQRVPEGAITSGFWRFAPDLAVEVLSPSETAVRLDEKLADYSVAGVPLVWVIDPEAQTVMVVAAQLPVQWLRAADTLDAGDVIPGFSCPVSQLSAVSALRDSQ
jgi:Uma2 family endonuclease